MQSYVCVEAELLEQAHVHRTRPRVAANKTYLLCQTVMQRLKVECLNGLVDGLLGHLTVGRPFAAGDCQQAALADVDHVVAHKALRVTRRGVFDQWA